MDLYSCTFASQSVGSTPCQYHHPWNQNCLQETPETRCSITIRLFGSFVTNNFYSVHFMMKPATVCTVKIPSTTQRFSTRLQLSKIRVILIIHTVAISLQWHRLQVLLWIYLLQKSVQKQHKQLYYYQLLWSVRRHVLYVQTCLNKASVLVFAFENSSPCLHHATTDVPQKNLETGISWASRIRSVTNSKYRQKLELYIAI